MTVLRNLFQRLYVEKHYLMILALSYSPPNTLKPYVCLRQTTYYLWKSLTQRVSLPQQLRNIAITLGY